MAWSRAVAWEGGGFDPFNSHGHPVSPLDSGILSRPAWRGPSSSWAAEGGGRAIYRYDRITVAVRDKLGQRLEAHLGLLCLRMARMFAARY